MTLARCGASKDRIHAPSTHFFMKLVFAAPASGLPFLSIAFGSQVSFAHFVMKLCSAAPERGLPSLPIALLLQVPSAKAQLKANVIISIARPIRVIFNLQQSQ